MTARDRAGCHAGALLAVVALLAGGTSCSKRSDAPVGPVLTPVPARAQVVSPEPAPAPRTAPAPPPSPQTIAKVRTIVAYNLQLRVREVPVDAPLSAVRKPPDDLAVVEIVLALEEAFRIEIPDQELEDATGGASPDDVSHISVRALAEIVERASRRGGAVPKS